MLGMDALVSHPQVLHTPTRQSILARLQLAKTGKEPNGRNHPDMQYFNMAVHTLGDMPQHKERYAAFMMHYMGRDEVVKRDG